ncbi:unnamed protein product [Closterium sp. NIES-53]
MAAANSLPALLLLFVLSSSVTFACARRLPSVQSQPESDFAAANALAASGVATAANRGGNVAECVAVGLSELASFLGASSRRVFSPRSVFMGPGAEELVSFTPRDKRQALKELSGSISNPTFAVESLTSYRLLNSLYKPANHALVVLGSVHSAAPGSDPGGDNNEGKFLAFWDQIQPSDSDSDDCSQWGVSWLMWQNRAAKDQFKRVPFTATISAASSVSPDATTELPAAAQAATDVPEVLLMDNDFGHLDAVKAAQSQNEEAEAHSSEDQEANTRDLGMAPQQSEVHFHVQTAWSAFVSALAADDVASASSILFGPEAAKLMAPGAESVTLATEQEKENLLNEFKASHLSLSVTVGDVEVLQDEGSKSFAALARSTYSIADAQGTWIHVILSQSN